MKSMSKNRNFDAYLPVRIAARPSRKSRTPSVSNRAFQCVSPIAESRLIALNGTKTSMTSESASLAGYSENTLLFNHLWHTGGIDFCVKWEDTPQHRPAKP